MKKFLFSFFVFFCLKTSVQAGNVILMMGDGMGFNHLKCTEMDRPIFLTTLPVKGKIHTCLANGDITYSAAAATAYACGQKTNNGFLGKLPDGSNCLTIAEESIQKGLSVGIYSTDKKLSGSPCAFFAHVENRRDIEQIKKYKEKSSPEMDIVISMNNLSDEVLPRLNKLFSNKKGFFAFFEEEMIDIYSEEKNFTEMKKALLNFDEAVIEAVNFVDTHPETTLIVLSDHETGELTKTCEFRTGWHTKQDVPLFSYGKKATLFEGVQDNTEIYYKMRKILFEEENSEI